MNPVYAAVDWGDCVVDEAATIRCLEPLFKNVVQGVVALVGIALFIMILNSGFRYLTSAGDPKKLEAARGSLTNAVVGVVLIAVGYLILKTIEIFTGVPVTVFSVPTPAPAP
jgi:hypothetical protein